MSSAPLIPPMGLIKEYADRSVQTDLVTVLSPYADPAVVLAAPPVMRRASASPEPQSPTSPMLAPLISRRLPRRRHIRCPAGESANRRIVSMPENRTGPPLSGKRVVSMPDRVRQELEPSVELFHSTSSTGGDSLASYGGQRERTHVFRAPSDIPQTPSPPSSPESLLIIAAGTQLPDGFLRRKYSPEPLIEEDEDWITWANSPPRPIPALHGPLSLPYARCPSGAEGTIIEEPDNVAQMIWGLGPDDQSNTQNRMEGLSSYMDNSHSTLLHGPNQVPSRLQKKRPGPNHQGSKSRSQTSTRTGHAKGNLPRTQRQAYVDEGSSQTQVMTDLETLQDIVGATPWNEVPGNIGVLDSLANDVDVFPGILEWQLARLRQALRTSLADMDSYGAYPGRLEPVIPASVTPGLSQSYPRIFVEPRPNEQASSATGQSSMEIAHQYRQQQLYRQALQKQQKMQAQNLLPTPPNSSSPQWSSHFSPYLAYCSSFSPESIGPTELPVSVPLQKHRPGTAASQYLHHVYERHEHDNHGDFDASKTLQNISNVNSAAGSSSSTLAKYIKQLQALSPMAHLPPLQSAQPNTHPSTLSSAEDIAGSLRSIYHSPAVPTPPSPESPQSLPRGALYHGARSMSSSRPMQRRLSSVPEEDSALLELSTSVSPPRLQNKVTNESFSSSHEGTMGHQTRYLEAHCVNMGHKSIGPNVPEVECNLGMSTSAHETSPAKVRLPGTKDHGTREQTGGYHQQDKGQQGHRKKLRFKKFKGPATASQQGGGELVD